MSEAAIPGSDQSVIPAARARSRVASERPASSVRTSAPASVSRAATALPIIPGAITATIIVISLVASRCSWYAAHVRLP